MSAMNVSTTEPLRAFHFQLEIAGLGTAQFVECSGVAANVERIAYRSGGSGQRVHQLTGNVSYEPLELRYGVTTDLSLWQWMQQSLDGVAARRAVSVILLASDGVTEAARYNLFEAWPCQWRAAALDAMSREVAIETLVLAYESLERA